MRWKLFRVTWLCAWRRLRPVLVSNPLLALLVASATVALPAAGLYAGHRLADEFAAAAAIEPFVRALAVAVAATATAAGAVVALLVPGTEALGRQLAAAPVARRAIAPALTVAPVLTAAAALAVPLALFAVPLAGAPAAPLLLAPFACAALGAAAAEATRLVLRREAAGVAIFGAAAAAWASTGAALGFAEAGPAAALVPALVRSELVLTSAGVAMCATGATLLWAIAVATDRREASARATLVTSVPLPRAASVAVALAVAKRLVRHRQLRLHVAAALVVPVAAVALFRVTLAVGGAALVSLAVAVAVTAAALLPPAALGLADDARWLVRTAPRRTSLLAAAAAAAGVALGLAIVAVDAAAVAPFAPADAATYLELEGAVAFVLGSAALAGAAVPWRPDRVVQQLASYGAVVAVVLAASLAVARTQGPAEALGLTAPWFGLVIGNGVLVAGVAAAGAVTR